MKWFNPWPIGFKVTSGFGYRIHPISKTRRHHNGIDIAGQFTVTAAGDGVVFSKGYNAKGGGNWVKIFHPEAQLYSIYYHGAAPTGLKKGQEVKGGETVIYTSGTTGASTGNHLHFELRTKPDWGTHVDPMQYLGSAARTGDETTPAPSPQARLMRTGRLDRVTVAHWQTWLKNHHYDPGPIDGIVGPKTIKAIQNWLAVPASGAMTPGTVRALQQYLDVKRDGVLGPKTAETLQIWLSNWKSIPMQLTKDWQEWLDHEGFHPGPIDGILGPLTIRAAQESLNIEASGILTIRTVKRQQLRVGVKEDGVIGRITLLAMESWLRGEQWTRSSKS